MDDRNNTNGNTETVKAVSLDTTPKQEVPNIVKKPALNNPHIRPNVILFNSDPTIQGPTKERVE
jgi:hypothetical protein